MPKMDGTGPQGNGPRTGRGMGRCRQASPERNPDSRGRGRVMGRGIGRGLGLRFGKGRAED